MGPKIKNMMWYRHILSLGLLTLLAWTAHAQEERKYIREGNKYYKEQNYDMAADAYKKAREKNPVSAAARFNEADVLYNQK